MKYKKNSGGVDSFIYGMHTVMATMKHQPKRCKKLYLARKDSAELIKLANKLGIEHEVIDRQLLHKKFAIESDSQGVVLLCSPFPYVESKSFLEHKVSRLLLLDTLQDNVNIGKIARSALCFGAHGIVICKDRSAQINAQAEKAAVGALAQIPVAKVTNLASFIVKLKELDFFVYGADMRGKSSLQQTDFAQKSALVIGQEGSGLRELTKKNCDMLIKIPMANEDICLNAADSALLMLYELNKIKGE